LACSQRWRLQNAPSNLAGPIGRSSLKMPIDMWFEEIRHGNEPWRFLTYDTFLGEVEHRQSDFWGENQKKSIAGPCAFEWNSNRPGRDNIFMQKVLNKLVTEESLIRCNCNNKSFTECPLLPRSRLQSMNRRSGHEMGYMPSKLNSH
jgi:hypothetical protein